VAVEIDRDLAAVLRERFLAAPTFRLIEGDALAGKHGLNPELAGAIAAASGEGSAVRLVANLPYNIASPLIVELLLAGVEVLAFTVQREVADRLKAGPAQGKAYGPLSVIVQSLAEVEVLRPIPAEAFWPRPKVESALVRLRRREIDPGLAGRERDFGRFVTALFTMRRKTLRKAVAGAMRLGPGLSTHLPAKEGEARGGEASRPLASAGLSGEERPDQLDAATLRKISLALPLVDPEAGGLMIAS
jgi:16S rRNA (adenine1518-N6/adenine1519-N6)-dimethyltransferase